MSNETPLKLIRHSPPNRHDELPYGTIIEVIMSQQKETYIQFSTDETSPQWELMQTEEQQ